MLETTIVILAIAGIAFLTYIIKSCYMSKCNKFKLGCLEIHRDTRNEQSASQLKLEIPKI
jgi:hypothetical protein